MNGRIVTTQPSQSVPAWNYRERKKPDFLQIEDVIRFFKFLYRYKWRIILMAILGVGAGYAYCQQAAKVYQSRTMMLVVQKRIETVTGLTAGMTGLEEDIATHVAVIRSPVFLERVVESGDLKSLPSFATAENPVATIMRNLDVARDTEYSGSPSSTLMIAYRGRFQEDCPKVLEAINDAYRRFLDETSRSGKKDTLARITAKTDEVLEQLHAKQKEYEDFVRTKLPQWSDVQQGIAFHRERLADVRSKQLDLGLEKSEAIQRLEMLKRAVEVAEVEGNFEGVLELIPEYRAVDRRSDANRFLVPLLIEERQLAQTYGPGHHGLKEVRDKIRYTKEYFSMGETEESGTPMSPRDTAYKYLKRLAQEVDNYSSSLETLDEVAEEENGRVRELADLELQIRQLTETIDQTRKYYDSLITQINGMRFTEDIQGTDITVLTPPTPARQVSPHVPLVMVGSLFAGLMAGSGLALIGHFSNSAFRDASEVRRRLGLPVVGHITNAGRSKASTNPDKDQNCDRLVCTYHQPDSVHSEAFRGLRTALFFNTQDDRRTIQVTSPNQGDGKSVLLANLAVSICYSGKRVLIVDADMRRPRAHELFGCDNSIGLSSILLDEADVGDALQETCVSGLALMASGPRPDSPADLLTSSRFEDLLSNLKLRFDYVLIDAPPLLPVTDGRIVSTRADGVLLLVQIGRNSRPQAEKAKQVLDDLEAFLLGVVVRSEKDSEFGFYAQPNRRDERRFLARA